MADPFEPGRIEPGRPAPTPPAQINPTQTGVAPSIQADQVSLPPLSQISQAQAGQVPLSPPAQAESRQSLVDNNPCPPSMPGGEREDAERTPLWDKACASLRAAGSKHRTLTPLQLEMLVVNLEDLTSNDSLGDRISQLNDAQQAKIRSKDGVRPTAWRKWLGRTARATLSMKDVAMGLARLDHHGIAPIVLGGVFTVIQVIQGSTEESLAAMTATLEIGYIVSLWNTVEKGQILRNRDPKLAELYGKLSDAIVRLYKNIVVLLGKMVAYFGKSRWRQMVGAIAPAHLEWKNIQTEIKSLETNCNNVKSQITLTKESREFDSQMLKSISSYDIRSTYKSVLERSIGIDERYGTRCQWLIGHEDFEEWYNPGESPVLWLNGTIGTGKTTLMTRAIREMQRSEMIDADAKPLAIFFFQKTFDPLTSLLDVETCLRSLVKQLSWNYATSKVQPVVEDFYNGLRFYNGHPILPSDNSAWTAGECVMILKDLISNSETYIMIDGVDECKDPEGLLRKLKELALLLKDDTDEHKPKPKPLHLMLCSRDNLPITDWFHDCLKITTSLEASKADETFYIEIEIDLMSRLKTGLLFFKSKNRYSDRLKKILKEKAEGVFRWTQIQIEIFTKRRIDESEIEDEFERLQSHTTHPELNKEYARLLDSLGESGRNRDRAMKMLRLLSCCFVPLTVENLAEAITASEDAASKHGTKRARLTADAVRMILVGFIREDQSSEMIARSHPDGTLFARLAHASVVEYLADDKSNVGDFSPLALHSEAASLCFTSISQGRQTNAPTLEFCLVPFATEFLGYSCSQWPEHCSFAFAEDGKCKLVRDTSRFILSEAYLIWNGILRQHSEESYSESWMELVWTNTDGVPRVHDIVRNPGFVIAIFGLTELLEISEIRSIVDLGDVNGSGWSLLQIVRHYTTHSRYERFMKWYPEQIQRDWPWVDPMLRRSNKIYQA